MFSLLVSILRSFLRESSSQTSKSLSFPKASIGNPDEIVTLRSTQGHGEYSRTMAGPPIKTFGRDHPEINSHECFLDSPSTCHKAVKPQPSRSDSRKGRQGNEKTGIMEWWNHGLCRSGPRPCIPLFHYSNIPVFGFDYLVPSQPCSDRSIVTPSGPLNLTSTLPRFAISSVPG